MGSLSILSDQTLCQIKLPERKAVMKPAKKGTQKSPKSTTAATGKKSKGFTDEERVAMRERAQELKAEARHGQRADRDELASMNLCTTNAPLKCIGDVLFSGRDSESEIGSS
jgi:hypothetical protein